MEKMKHTPGPWRYDDKTGDSGGLVVWAEGGDRVARVCWDSCDEQSEALSETEPNARLIAAAPELLEALQDAMKLIDVMMPGVRCIPLQDYAALNNTPIKARAAIAKATGR